MPQLGLESARGLLLQSQATDMNAESSEKTVDDDEEAGVRRSRCGRYLSIMTHSQQSSVVVSIWMHHHSVIGVATLSRHHGFTMTRCVIMAVPAVSGMIVKADAFGPSFLFSLNHQKPQRYGDCYSADDCMCCVLGMWPLMPCTSSLELIVWHSCLCCTF